MGDHSKRVPGNLPRNFDRKEVRKLRVWQRSNNNMGSKDLSHRNWKMRSKRSERIKESTRQNFMWGSWSPDLSGVTRVQISVAYTQLLKPCWKSKSRCFKLKWWRSATSHYVDRQVAQDGECQRISVVWQPNLDQNLKQNYDGRNQGYRDWSMQQNVCLKRQSKRRKKNRYLLKERWYGSAIQARVS